MLAWVDLFNYDYLTNGPPMETELVKRTNEKVAK
jgi:hypothetical protein